MRRSAQLLIVGIAFCLLASAVRAQNIETYAGGGPGLIRPYGVAVDLAGNIYTGDYATHRVYKVTPGGQIVIVAGNGIQGYNGDGILATNASLNYPPGVAVDGGGNVFIADYYNHRIRRVDASTGIITTVAGNGVSGYNGDGITATSANLYYPVAVDVDSAGNLYIVDQYNSRIRFVDHSTGTISTVVGNGCSGYNGEFVTATSACLATPYDVKLDAAGNLYEVDWTTHRVRRVDASGPNAGKIHTIAGSGVGGFGGDGGPATSAMLNNPVGIALDGAGNIFIADFTNNRVRFVNVAGIMGTLAGNGSACTSNACGDGGSAAASGVYAPVRLAADGAGNLFFAEPWPSQPRLRQVSLGTGIISTRVGGGISPGDGLPATLASLNYPLRNRLDASGNLFIVEYGAHRIRRVDAATHIMTTVAGNGCVGYNGDNIPATSACLYYPFDVSPDQSGNLFIADYNNSRIRRVDAVTGKISTFAGTGSFGYNGDNIPATSAYLSSPLGVVADTNGNVWIADYANQRVRRVDASGPNAGKITTVAGSGCYGYNGDGIPATSACLYYPYGLDVDTAGNLFIADFYNYRVRRVDASGPNAGKISTVAGSGCYGYNGENIPATSACTSYISDVAVDAGGNVYFSDLYNYRVRRVDATGVSAGKVRTIAGSGSYGFSGDGGPATSASLTYPYGVAVDLSGNVYIPDLYNNRVRRVVNSTDTTPPIITPTIIGTLGNNGWYVSNVSVSWSVADNESAITSQTGCGGSSVTSDTNGVSFTCTATSAGGTSSQSVTIKRDTTAPVLTLPPNQSAQATGSSGAVVSFTATAHDNLAGALTPSCNPASGSTFPIGATTVNCSAGDPAGNQASGSFSVNVSQASQTISFAALPNRTYGNADFAVVATATSGLAVSFTVGALDNCAISGNTLHITGAGSCTVTAHQSGNGTYAAATDVPQSFAISKANASVTPSTASRTYGTADPSFTGTPSGFLAADNVTASYSRTAGETVAGSPYIISATLNPAGALSNYNITYNTALFTISKADQTISFAALASKTFGDAPFGISASASSGLAVSFGASGNCSVAGSMVSITGAGSCTMTASQAGDGNYNAAPNVPQSFAISKADQTITFGALSNKTYGDAAFAVSATASSGLVVSFSASGNCSIAGSMVSITGAGSCTITTSQAGDGNFNAAPNSQQSFSTAKALATIVLGNLSQTFDTTPKSATAATNPTGLSGVSITYNGSAAAPTNAGSYAVDASLNNANYQAPDATGTLVISPANQTINFPAITSQTYGNAPFGISATATSGLAVSFSVSGNCSLAGSTVTITGAGSCMITASQAGNANYNAAANVSQAVTIAKANQTLTWPTPANIVYGTALSGTQLNATVTAPGTSPAGALTYSPAAGTVLGPGSAQTLIVTAAATANYNSATLTVKINVLYASGGMCYGDVGHSILQPINGDGSSVWKQGSTVPAKFRVCDINGMSVGTAGVVTGFVLYQINSGTIAPVDETTFNSTNDLGWRFDSTAQQWIFNMSTKTAPQNVANRTYYYRIDLNDGTSIFLQFGLK